MGLTDQGQHRISKVYLRQFAFRDKSNAEIISVLEVGNPTTQYKKIKSFTKTLNLFDTKLADEGFSRYFEEYSQKVETHYPKVIETLKIKNEIDAFSRSQLILFVSNLFIRQSKTREYFLIPILQDENVRKKLFNEITMFSEQSNLLKAVLEEIAIDPEGTLEDKINLIAAEIWGHLQKVFDRFTFLVLRAPEGTGWFSSDNPVIVDTRDNTEAWMIPPQSEIYFTLSSEYLLFMHNHRVQSSNPITLFPENKVTEAPVEIQHEIMMSQILKSTDRFYICSADLGIVDVRTA